MLQVQLLTMRCESQVKSLRNPTAHWNFWFFFQSRSSRPTPEGKDPGRDQYISVWPVLSSEPKARALWRSVTDHWTWRFFWACPKKGAKRTHHLWTALWFAVEQHLQSYRDFRMSRNENEKRLKLLFLMRQTTPAPVESVMCSGLLETYKSFSSSSFFYLELQ